MTDTPQAVAEVVARVQRTYAGWRRDTPAAQMRADWDALFAAEVAASVTPVDVAGCPAEWVQAPGAGGAGVLLYLHGGGFRVGSCASHRELMAGLSAQAGCRVLGLDYRLLPDHPVSAAQADVRAAWQWLLDQGHAPAHLALCGDSVGGWLVLWLLLTLRDEGRALPAAAVTMSALTDLSVSGESYETRAAADPIHQRPMIQAIARVVLGGTGDPCDPRHSPLFAALHGLPPLLMQAGDCETVLSDTTEFAARARAAGVDARDEIWPGMIHVFQQFPTEFDAARRARASIGQFLRDRLVPSTL